MKPEELLNKLSKEEGYPSFPSFVENEDSIEAYNLACKAMVEYALFLLPSDEEIVVMRREYDNSGGYDREQYMNSFHFENGLTEMKSQIINKLKT